MNNNLKITVPMSRDQREIFDKMTEAVSNSSVKTVSFNLFGTLLLFPFSEDKDIYLLLEREFPDVSTAKSSFSDLRIEAEAEARRKSKEKCSVSIEEIYSILAKKAKISADVRDTLIKRECELALSFVFPRGFGKKLCDTASERGKSIILAADTIYPYETVLAMAEKCGISGKLLMARDVDSGENRNDALFDAILKKSKASAGSHLHIGGDIAADVETPLMKGAKALLLADVKENMAKTGRLQGYFRSERIFEYDTAEYIALHIALGIYSAYIFDIPRNKAVQSDFCGNAYIMGFIVGGCGRYADISRLDAAERAVLNAISDNEDTRRGGDDFYELFRRHSAEISHILNFSGFELPLKLLTAHGGAADTGLLKSVMDGETYRKWKDSITDAPAAPKIRSAEEQNSLEKLADRMFPPGTRVRNIADGILLKMKRKGK